MDKLKTMTVRGLMHDLPSFSSIETVMSVRDVSMEMLIAFHLTSQCGLTTWAVSTDKDCGL
ncbi:hypothetical protein KSP40_PGU022678 [Platanthera guangdongensis]|uniref:Uncharacterized protein n=1 Tax=Platanthera guangdongensis TaxID=2320717 RepID=A0ABR2LYX1_9ASPA